VSAKTSPNTSDRVIYWFTAKRTIRSATYVALAFAVFAASKVIGYVGVYPDVAQRIKVAPLLVNSGYTALFGTASHLELMPSFTAWYSIGIGTLFGAIWAYLITTKAFRGEEASGRFELMLSSPTTMQRATLATLKGVGVSLALYFAIVTVAVIGIGLDKSINYSAQGAIFLAIAIVSSAVIFASVGALASQLMPTRARAAGLTTIVFALSFALRAAGDVTSSHWLTNLSPLGWIEKLRPLTGSDPVWLIPIVLFSAVCLGFTVWMSGRRDLGESVFADHDTAKPHTALLGNQLSGAIRLTRGSTIAWLIGIGLLGVYFGALSKSVASVLNASAGASTYIAKLSGAHQQAAATKGFLGVVYLLIVMVLMAYAAYAVGGIRTDEAKGYVDNLLIQPISRLKLLGTRIGLAVVVIIIAGLLSSLLVYAGLGPTAQSINLKLQDLAQAGVNALAPALFTLGVAVLAYGLVPRLTTVIGYGVIVWSFLMQLAASGLNLNHWFLDTSVFTHVALAPAVSPHWTADVVMVILGLVLAVGGAYFFNRRDLANE
jgi:polyether ionophore transport system permease protein